MSEVVTGVVTFGLGPGPGQRLLAPGLPDALFTDGASLGWLTRDGVYVLLEDYVHFVSAPGAVQVAASPEMWAVAAPSEEGWIITRFRARDPRPVRYEVAARSLTVGATWAVLDVVHEREVISLQSGVRVPIPAGAADARPQPFTDGVGVVWVAGSAVYRLQDGGRVQSVGVLPSRPAQWLAGPQGSAVFWVDGCVWAMGPSGAPMALEGLGWEGLRFSPSGDRVLGITVDGIEERCLRSGVRLWGAQGPLSPAGFSTLPVYLDERTGRVLDSEGRVFAGGFNPSAAVLAGDVLYGPGGSAWDLIQGGPAWAHAPLSADHLVVMDDLLVAIGEDIQLLNLDGTVRRRLQLPINLELEGMPIDVYADGTGAMCCEMEDGAFRLTTDGQRLPLDSAPADATSSADDQGQWIKAGAAARAAWPGDLDGAAEVAGRLWVWSEDGMLCALS